MSTKSAEIPLKVGEVVAEPTNPFEVDDDDENDDSEMPTSPTSAAVGNNISEKTPTDNKSNFSLKNMFVRSSKQASGTADSSNKKVKSKIWHSIVNIVLIEGKDFIPKADNTLPDPFVKFKLGSERYKSKTKQKTLSAQWLEQFDLYMFEDQTSVLEISVRYGEIGSTEIFLGRCELDLDGLEREKTHKMEQLLDDNNGSLSLLVTVCNTSSPSSTATSPTAATPADEQQTSPLTQLVTADMMAKKYTFLNSFKDVGNVGWLQVRVLRAYGLAAADIGGTSDPFCVVELCNARVQTPTVYKTLTPEWNKTFTFTVTDIHTSLEVSVLDENRSKKVDFLGKIAIPLLNIKSGERVWYQLKDPKLLGRKKGVIQLEIDFVYNQIKAAIRTFNPKERKYTQPEPKFKVGTMKKNIDRVSKVAQGMVDTAKFIQSCLDWDSKPKSIIAFAIFLIAIINFELFMLPALIVVIFLKNLMVLNIVESFKDNSNEEITDYEGDDDDDLDPKKKKVPTATLR